MADEQAPEKSSVFHHYVCGLYFDNIADDVLLLKKAKPAWQKDKYNGVGGKVEHSETVHQAMSREFKEETGVAVSVDRWTLFCQLYGTDFKVLFFRADRVTEDGEPIGSAEEPVKWFHLDALEHAPLISNIPWLVEMANNRSHHDWPYRIYEKDGN